MNEFRVAGPSLRAAVANQPSHKGFHLPAKAPT